MFWPRAKTQDALTFNLRDDDGAYSRHSQEEIEERAVLLEEQLENGEAPRVNIIRESGRPRTPEDALLAQAYAVLDGTLMPIKF